MTKVLITGANGLVGTRVVELLRSDFDLTTPHYPDFDLTNLDSVHQVVQATDPDWIIHLAAFTDVNASELQTNDKSGSAWQINVEGTNNLVNSFSKSSRFIHISTDMVFSGSKEDPGPYIETHQPENSQNKLSWYGWTKNQAEQIVQAKGGTIIRINYPVRFANTAKLDYLHSPLSKYKSGRLHPLFNDQQVGITFIDELANSLSRIIINNLAGIFHVSSSTTTPFEFVKYALAKLGQDTSTLQSSSVVTYLSHQTNPHRYPIFGGLDCQLTEQRLDMKFLDWQAIIDRFVSQGLNMDTLS